MSSRARWGSLLLLVLGLTRMVADLSGASTVAAVAGATGASPAPKVFSSVRGLETFSSGFSLSWTNTAGEPVVLEITPANAARIQGPYNRRNVYGAVLAYAPVLEADPRTQSMYRSVARSAMCQDRPLIAQ